MQKQEYYILLVGDYSYFCRDEAAVWVKAARFSQYWRTFKLYKITASKGACAAPVEVLSYGGRRF